MQFTAETPQQRYARLHPERRREISRLSSERIRRAKGVLPRNPPTPEGIKAYRQAYYQAHREKLIAASKARYQAHKEEVAIKWRSRTEDEKQRYRERDRIRSLRRREWREKYRKQYFEKNKERLRAEGRKRYKPRPEYLRAYYKNNREKVLRGCHKYYKAHKQDYIARVAKRKAIQLKATVNLKSILDWQKRVKSKPTFKCYWCQQAHPISKLHFDHIVPLSKGGPHSVENLCASCSPCNLSKHATLVSEWYKAGQLILGI